MCWVVLVYLAFSNDTCLKEILIAQKSSMKYDAVQTFLGGSGCDKYYQSSEECVTARLFQPDVPGVGYTVIGLSERMPESLELFNVLFYLTLTCLYRL